MGQRTIYEVCDEDSGAFYWIVAADEEEAVRRNSAVRATKWAAAVGSLPQTHPFNRLAF